MPEPPSEREQVRERAAAIAIDLFSAKGFAATTTRELASELGFTKATLYHYFPTKEDVLLAILRPVAAALEGIVDSVGGSSELDVPQRRTLLSDFADFHVTYHRAVDVLFNDPSSKVPEVVDATRPSYQRILHLVTGRKNPRLTDLVRARVALGGIAEALRFRTFETDFHADVRIVKAEALDAACAALGIPGD